MSDGLLLEAKAVSKRYVDGPREISVLRDLDMQIEAGETVGVIGASGVGKSTLLHILGGLDRPSEGSLTIDGTDVFALTGTALAAFRNRMIGFVFQFHQLLPDFTALENVVLPARIGRARSRDAHSRAEHLLAHVGLADRLHHRPGELSGGEQQRVAVARAMMCEPRLLLADEPTGNLDPETGARVRDVLLGLNREFGAALVIATHNHELAGAMGRVVTLLDGRVERATTPPPSGSAQGSRV